MAQYLVVRNIERVFEEAGQNTRKKHEKWAKYYNRWRREVNIKIDDLVLVEKHPISSASKRVVAKLFPKYEGPYRVLSVKSNNVVIWKAGCDGSIRSYINLLYFLKSILFISTNLHRELKRDLCK